MSTLRAKLALPLVILFLVFGIASTTILLWSVESSLVSHIKADLQLIRSAMRTLEGDASPEISEPLVLPFAPNRSALVIPIGENDELPPVPNAARGLAGDIALASEISPPEKFLSNPAVGEVFADSNTGSVSRVAVLLPTRTYQSTYDTISTRILGLTTVASIAGILLAVFLVDRLSRRLHELTIFAENLELQRHAEGGGGSIEEIDRLENALRATSARIHNSAEEISRLQIMRSQFLANVSHEVRTPLFSLKGFLETLLEGGIDDPAVNRTFLEKSLNHAERIDNLLRDLIDISRIESGEMRMSFRYFRLSSLFDQVREDHEDMAALRSQSLDIRQDVGDIEVMGDKERLREALANLVENALKYSPEGSTVTVSAERADLSVRISVSDSGPGIEAKHLGRIFERFYRVDPDRSRQLGGTGLGLAIVKHIIEAHGSKINVSSSVGRGTSFSFLLRS